MGIAIGGSYTPDVLKVMPCGGTPYFEHDTGYAYRCGACNAIIGSVAQPQECKDKIKEEKWTGR